ncbi:MAG TPA: class I SAM-dependent methyltransferase [Phycisphaerae bacterium]|nr:class I SAM-dependent methyltransferase [Phycisphaerae bacterium]
MARRRKPAVQRYHDRVAGRYDATYDDDYWLWHDALTWDHLKPHLPSDTRKPVLDLGCGTGKWALKLLKSGYPVTCVDISGPMVERARRKIEEAAPTARASFVQADLCDLSELAAGEFALAVAFGDPIGCSTSPPKALKEIRRRLTDDGLLAATFDNRWAAIDYYLERARPDELDEFLKSGRTHWLTRDRDEQFPIHTYSPAQAVKLLERAGFEIVDLIGKTVLPMRHHRELLTDGQARRTWMKIEKRLWRDPAAIGRAAHIQVIARKSET